MKFLTGSDYPDLCSKCRMVIDQAVDIVSMGADTDDEEAPCNFVYDKQMFCGGHECKAEDEETYGLTAGQRMVAKTMNMTNKEYANYKPFYDEYRERKNQ